MIPGIKVEEFTMPSLAPSFYNKNIEGYAIKYLKAAIGGENDDSLALSDIQTRALRGDDIVLLTEDKFTFMDQYFIIVKYMEKVRP